MAIEIRDRIVELRRVKARELREHPLNPRTHPPSQTAAVRLLLEEIGMADRLLTYRDAEGNLRLVDGHLRREIAGDAEVPVLVTDLSEEEAAMLLAVGDPLAGMAQVDGAVMAELLQQTDGALLAQLLGLGEGLAELLGQEEGFASAERDGDGMSEDEARRTLSERFGVPPFSVLDARQGYWQERKRAWLALGIQSELGRGENLLDFSERAQIKRGRGAASDVARCFGQDLMRGEHTVGESRLTWVAGDRPEEGLDETSRKILAAQATSGTSIFDPVLCELAYRWFCPDGGSVLDPFAGGSVRGIVAAKLGRRYVGIDLSARQIAANEEQAVRLCGDLRPVWKVGDSRRVRELAAGEYDFVFSCPPYADLEVYSDDPADLSTLDYPAFLTAYREIVAGCVAMLKPDRFACFCVGDVRDRKGFYRNFVSDTIPAFEEAGARLYNEAILVTAAGSLPIRVGRQFGRYRKLGKTHQNVLVFLKGDPKRIPEVLGEVEIVELPEPED